MKPIIINGWDFSPKEYETAWNEGSLLTASIETSNICNLACEYCFREEGNVVSKKRLKKEISLEDSLNLISDLAKLGVKTINIAGAGEPLLDSNLPSMLEKISSYDIVPLVATNGSLIDESWINLFNKTNTSLMIKVNSFNEEKQNVMVHRKNYSSKRDHALELLITNEFNLPAIDGSYQTRLSINSLVSKKTISEIPEIFNYCRKNKIMPCMETYIPAGKTAKQTEDEISKIEFLKLAEKIRLKDSKNNIEYMRLWPYLGGVPCTQQGKASIFINILGDIYDCPAGKQHYGNIKEKSIKNAFEEIKKTQTNYCLGCPIRDEHYKI